MNQIRWCLSKKNGLELIEPNDNLREAYQKKAEEALESMRLMKNKDWKITTAYYTLYFSLYSILMKLGIKCEIHSCTIAFMKEFLDEYFTREECSLLENSLNARVNAQYYIDRKVPDSFYEEMIEHAPEFFAKCKSTAQIIDEGKILEIQDKLKAMR